MIYRALVATCVFLFTSSVFASAMVYIPQSFSPQNAKVIVVIHGCLQSAESMALGSGWNQKAQDHNLVIIYPQVPLGSHALDCWSWFNPENQKATSGQLLYIRNQINTWKKTLKIPQAPVYVAGISSGGATVSGLLACFPNDFAAGAIHSGVSYGLATTQEEAESILKYGPKPDLVPNRECHPKNYKKPILIIHGSRDQLVNPLNTNAIIDDFLSHAKLDKTEQNTANGLIYRVESYLNHNHSIAGRLVTVEGLGHAWAGYVENLKHSHLLGPKKGFPTIVPFFTDRGPSSTNLIFDFFTEVEKESLKN